MKFRLLTFPAVLCLSILVPPKASAHADGYSEVGTFDTITVQP